MSVEERYHKEVQEWLNTGAVIHDAIATVADQYEVPDSAVLGAYYRVRNSRSVVSEEPVVNNVINLAVERQRRRGVPQWTPSS